MGLDSRPMVEFLTNVHLITEKELEELNRQRRPLIVPHLDESRWLVQERKVINFRGIVASHIGNMPTMKLFQILALEMRPASMLQGGYCGDPEIHGCVEAKLGGIQRYFEDSGMKYDGGGNNDA